MDDSLHPKDDILANVDTSEWENGWPSGYFDLFGCSPDFPSVPDAAPISINI